MKKVIAIAAAGVIGILGLSLTNFVVDKRPVLKVANWAEYIDIGDEEEGTKSLIEEFEIWYKQQTGKEIRVEYCIADDNETLYNMIKMGDHFDLVCPSEYMLMKLVAENRVQKLPESFYDTTVETNYYAKNVSPFIEKTFEQNTMTDGSAWKEYAAGYMWGTTGFVYHPDASPTIAEDVKNWSIFTNPTYNKKITAKNNIRDTYFTGLAMHYDAELRAAKAEYQSGKLSTAEYQALLKGYMNDTTPQTMDAVKKKLMSMTDNLYGFETDEGKSKIVAGDITVNFQWSGDAVYVMNVADGSEEDEDTVVTTPVYLNYSIPETVSNLWFDGWALTEDCNDVNAATMFINFLSMPENAVRNMNYIGYTSCIGSKYVYENFVLDCYEAEDGEADVAAYDLNYYFNPNYDKSNPNTASAEYVFYAPSDQLQRQLFAQYPDEETLTRCVAMDYFNYDDNARANSMWSDITFF